MYACTNIMETDEEIIISNNISKKAFGRFIKSCKIKKEGALFECDDDMIYTLSISGDCLCEYNDAETKHCKEYTIMFLNSYDQKRVFEKLKETTKYTGM